MEASERRIREKLGLEAGGPEAPLAWAAGPGAPGGRGAQERAQPGSAQQELAAARREIELLRALLAEKDKIIRMLENPGKETDG
jgi:hypothetical protein